MERASHSGAGRRASLAARVVAVLLGITFLLLALLLASPLETDRIASRPDPSRSFEESLARTEALRAHEDERIAAPCRVLLLHHGRRTARAFVFLHGLTNCPNQFLWLAEAARDAGHNALVLRLPGHGHSDRMTDALRDLKAEQLAALADLGVDLGVGLGDSVTLVGLSVGGVMAAWAGQHRAELDRAVLFAPSFGFAGVPEGMQEPLGRAFRAVPNQFWWWDPLKREANAGPVLAYPRYATRTLGEILRLSAAVRRAADRRPTAASVLVVTNAADAAVSNGSTAAVVRAWRRHESRVETFEFPANWKLEHDFVDPDQPEARPDLVAPKLLEILGIRPKS